MIYLLRHGETEFNREGRYQGRLDSPLTALGRTQARGAGARLRTLLADAPGYAITSSPLGRARDTAALVREELGADGFGLDARLAEIDMGVWNGLTDDDIEGQFPGARDGASRYDWAFRAPGAETPAGFYARLRSWLDEAQADGRVHVAVSHGIAGRGLCALYTGQTMGTVRAGRAPQDTIFRLWEGRIEAL
jgi:probable phosphoglycerate mutase